MRGAFFIAITLAFLASCSEPEPSRSIDPLELSSSTDQLGPPRIERVMPSVIAAGESLEILGAGFTEDCLVFLEKRALAIESRDLSRLRVRIPDPAASGAIILKSGYGETRFEGLEIVPYYPPPKIDSVSPDEVRAGGLLHIRGSGFGEENRAIYLSIGGELAEIIERRDDRLIARVPADAKSGTLIVVVARGGQAIAQLPVRVIRALESAPK